MEIRDKISLAEANQLIDDVVESVFANGKFSPMNRDVITDLYAVVYFCPEYFADKEIDIEQFYSDYINIEEYNESTSELSTILTEITKKEQFFKIYSAITNRIVFEQDKLIHKNSLNEELSTLVSKITAIVDNMSTTISPETLEKILPAFENIGKLTDINQETVVKEIVSSLKPIKKTKTTGKNIKIAK